MMLRIILLHHHGSLAIGNARHAMHTCLLQSLLVSGVELKKWMTMQVNMILTMTKYGMTMASIQKVVSAALEMLLCMILHGGLAIGRARHAT
jgi:hypothetical protein